MRFDAIGLFWEDLQTERGRGRVHRVMPEIPETGWTAPTEFPNLSGAKVICVDVETYDPELTQSGPGWARGVGHLVGVSIGVADGGRWYFPMRHEVRPEENLDPDAVMRWLADVMAMPCPKLGANIMYDVGWLIQSGIEVNGPLIDIQFAEALLSEASSTALEDMAQKYLGEGKESNLLYQWCADYYGGKPNGAQRANIYRAPPSIVGPYAESDADLPLKLADKLYPLLYSEGLLDLFDMENRLMRLLIAMRFAGVHVDIKRAEEVQSQLEKHEAEVQARLNKLVGVSTNVNSAQELARAFDRLGLEYGKTTKGAPSFTKAFISTITHPVGDLIREIRESQKTRSTFVEGYILNKHVDEMLYCQFHPLRGQSGGTRSGRFSSSDPNLQNIPARHPVIGPLVRGLFIPDVGHSCWRKYDYSQIEYRFLAHFAIGPGADEIRRQYRQDPSTDYHIHTQKLVHEKTNRLIDRKPIKNINFGLIYGMGKETLAKNLKLGSREAYALFDAYHRGAPFAKATMDDCSNIAQTTGVITTILGRKSRFDLWESKIDYESRATSLDNALKWYGSVRRAYTHKALNRRLQGSAADLMKVAMLKAYEDGIFDVTGVPRLTVHDELDFSDPGGCDDAFEELKYVLENTLQLNVPVKVDLEVGPNWGQVKEVDR